MNAIILTGLLLNWFRHNRREMPWRQTTDPYRIWVSEIMLQQTQVNVVVPYYERFIRRFPDMQALAGATEEEIISAWQGLGYYSRVRNLQNGVREVLASYGGKVPDRQDQILSLPGVGPYTAGAILSIAFGKKTPAIDGNVLRVISRLHDIREAVGKAQTHRRISGLVHEKMPEKDPGEFNQALMELGALVCTPKSPRCPECPWTDYCLAKRAGVHRTLPVRRESAGPQIVIVWAGLFIDQGSILVRRRPKKGILAGMWELPSVESSPDETSGAQMAADLIELFHREGHQIRLEEKWTEIRHVFSHREWRICVWRCSGARAAETPCKNELRWIDRAKAQQVNWAGPYRKISDAWINDNDELEG